jgi:hypothetical protein
MTASPPRPRVVTAAFCCWVVAAVLLVAGGLIAAAWSNVPVVLRGAGGVSAVAGLAMAFLASRSRGEDGRYRRAGVALAMTLVVLISISSALGVGNVLTLLAVLPLIAGSVLITRPSAFDEEEPS